LNYPVSKLVSGYPFSCFKKNPELTKRAYKIGRGPYIYFKEIEVLDKEKRKSDNSINPKS
jgi:hypothetical protein